MTVLETQAGERQDEQVDRLAHHALRGKVWSKAVTCSKSSLVRAGVIPKLKRNKDRWLVLNPLRPLGRPFAGLAEVLAPALHRGSDSQDWQSIRDALRASADNLAPVALLRMVYDLREATARR